MFEFLYNLLPSFLVSSSPVDLSKGFPEIDQKKTQDDDEVSIITIDSCYDEEEPETSKVSISSKEVNLVKVTLPVSAISLTPVETPLPAPELETNFAKIRRERNLRKKERQRKIKAKLREMKAQDKQHQQRQGRSTTRAMNAPKRLGRLNQPRPRI